jgi:CubicO group peptidase (beta-lactamase class C family)
MKHVIVCWSLCLLAATAPGQSNAPLEERVAAMVKAEILAKGVPSVSVAVMRDGKMLMEGAWGHTDVDKNLQASTSTVYPIGSVSKEITAALVLKQVDRGRLALTDPIGKHLAGLDPEIGAVTIEQLLNHTSGLKGAVIEPDTRHAIMSVEALLAQAVRDKLETKPGSSFRYSNAGYTVLGALVEKLSGKSYAAALHDEIAAPLGLQTLRRCADPKPGEAPGYMNSGGKLGPPPGPHHSQVFGAGGVCTTAADLVRWRHALHGGRVLSASSYTAMTTPRGAAVSGNYGFGLYVRPAQWGDMAIVGGGQALSGHTAELHWYPGQSLAVALLYNAAPRVPGVADLIPRLVLGVPLPGKAPENKTASAASPSATTGEMTTEIDGAVVRAKIDAAKAK